ncbi:MAG: FAD-binding and (Fe-S)-binding domain-containing protein [Granulosicoccus sp.]
MTAIKTHHPELAHLHEELRNSLQGDCDFSAAGVALYTSDASNYRQIPLGVVFPKNIDDVKLTTKYCREHGLAVLMRGGGTSQNGQCVNEAVILDCSRYMNNVVSIDTEAGEAVVEPGIVCDALKAAAEQYGLTFGPDPATHSRCTLGGMIGNNSCGPHSMLAGKTVENVVELEVLTAAGDQFWVGPTSDTELEEIISKNDGRAQIYRQLKSIRDEYEDDIRSRYPSIKRRVSGYNLDQLLPENGFNVARALVGSEGTLVSVLQAKVSLIENPNHKQLVVLGFDNIYIAGDCVPEIMPFEPIAMEGLDWSIIGGLNDRNLKQREVALLPEGKAWILTELAAKDTAALSDLCDRFERTMNDSARVRAVKLISEPSQVTDIWSIREQGASATAMNLDPTQPDPVVGWEDTAVDPNQLGDYLRAFQTLVDRYGYSTSLYGHFGDGCIHARITFDTRTSEGVKHWKNFSREIAELVVKFGGSLSGEHGDGQAKAEFLPIMFGTNLMRAFQQFKAAWDPEKRMNPGKLIDAYKMDENLRFGPEYQRPAPTTSLAFVEDLEGFGRSSERCIGMGKCRAQSGAMCPSYQVSGEERYSTRGRAHLLHEMLRGDVIKDGWDNDAIADSLEHCLSCKACKHECPTQVDIASYKAEFMSAHYQRKSRPFSHHVFGKIGTTLPKLAPFAGLTNRLQKSTAGSVVKKWLGISQEKNLPELAKLSFKGWTTQHAQSQDAHFFWFGDESHPPVVLWSDTVNAHYRPGVLISAIKVLSRCGFKVAVSRAHFCCGRPLYEYGFLAQAKQQLQDILETLYPQLPDGSQLIVLEPSCLSVFKDEIQRTHAEDARAQDIRARTCTLTEFLDAHGIEPKTTLNKAVLHVHCHEKSSGGSYDRTWMKRCFKVIEEPESSCCGMAGTFGMKEKTRHLGLALFTRKLNPTLQRAAKDTIVVTNGFSCHEQVKDHSELQQMHPVQVIEKCL